MRRRCTNKPGRASSGSIKAGEADAIIAELGPNWRAPLPPNPSPAEEAEAWCQDAQAVHDVLAVSKILRGHASFHRTEAARMEILAAYHRARSELLEAVAT